MVTTKIELFHPVHLPEMEVAFLNVMRSGQIASGPKVFELEKTFSEIIGREHIIATSDMTSAVTLALHLAGVTVGDEVATICFSCLQSNSPIARLGARPVWIDIDPETMSMSIDDLEAKLVPSVKAVMVYHVAGYPTDTYQIASLCRARGIPLIEDCNNAIGATLNGRQVGVYGDYAIYSLYPTRQINGIDGGILATPDATTADRAARLRRFGIDSKTFRDPRGEINTTSDIAEIGWSFSLNNLHAAIALSQLNSINERLLKTRAIASMLIERLSEFSKIRLVNTIKNAKSAYWCLFLLVDDRNQLLEYLKENGIGASTLHQRNDRYTGFNTQPADLPGTTIVMDQLIALPCGWWLNKVDIDQIIELINKFYISK